MKSFSSLLFALLTALMLLPATEVRAQDNGSNPLDFVMPRAMVLIGPTVGINRNFHTGGFRLIEADASCPVFESGSGWGFVAGLSAELLFGETWSLIPRLTYESRPGSFTQDLPDALVQDPKTLELVNQHVSTNSEIQYSLINVEVLYKQEVAMLGKSRISLAGGPAFAIPLSSSRNRQVLDLITPENARLTNPEGRQTENNGRRIVFYDDVIPNQNSTRLSLKAGALAEFGLFGNAWIMTPGLYYDFGLTDVSKGSNWTLSTLMFLIDFRRAL